MALDLGLTHIVLWALLGVDASHPVCGAVLVCEINPICSFRFAIES